MSAVGSDGTSAGHRGLEIKDAPVLSARELETLRNVLGTDLDASSTLRRWQAGEPVAPHSVSVALEAVLRMLGPNERAVAPILEVAIGRLVDAFPEETLPL